MVDGFAPSLSWWDTAPVTRNQRCRPRLSSPCGFGRGLVHCACGAHILTTAQGGRWPGGPAPPFLWRPQNCAVEACYRLPREAGAPEARLRRFPGGQAAGQLAFLDLAVRSPFFHPCKTPSCRLSLEATRTLPSVLTCFASALVAHLPATLPVVCAPPPPPQGGFSSSLQSPEVGGRQLVGAWQREGSWAGRRAGATFCSRGFLEFPSDDPAGDSGWESVAPSGITYMGVPG